MKSETIKQLQLQIVELEKRIKKLEDAIKPIFKDWSPTKPYSPTRKETEEEPWKYFKERITWL